MQKPTKKQTKESSQPSKKELEALLWSFEQTSLEESECQIKAFIKQYPKSLLGWQLMGANLMRAGRATEALRYAVRAIEIDSVNPALHNNLGNIYRALKRLDEAERSFRKALRLQPTLPQAHNNLGNVLLELGRLDEAEACYRKAVVIDPKYSNAHSNLGNTLRLRGKLTEAEAACKKALEKNPRHVTALNNLGNVLRDLHRREDAVATFKRILEIDPTFSDAYSNLGNALHDLGNFEEAVRAYETAIRLKPDHAEAYNNSGNSFRQLGDHHIAIKRYKDAISLRPDYAEAHCNLAVTCRDVGEYAEAEHHCSQALQLKPDLVEAHRNLGWLLLEKGAPLRALESALTALRLEPSLSSKRLIVQCFSMVSPNQFSSTFAELSIHALEGTWGNLIQLARFSQNLLLRETRLHKIVQQALDYSKPIELTEFLGLLNGEPLLKRLMDLTLTSAPLSTFEFEQFITKLRHQMLMQADGTGLQQQFGAEILHLKSLIARQSYINEYVFSYTDQEMQKVAELRGQIVERLNRSQSVPEDLVLLLASYESLSKLPKSERLVGLPCSPALKCVIEQQIHEPQVEQSLKSFIPRLTDIQDAVSLEVQSQYEQNPYPRWIRLPTMWDATPINQRIRDLFPHVDFVPLNAGLNPSILIAGCGTGQQPIEVARLIKDSDVLAVDLSMTSLAYAKRKALEACVNNISFAQADILKLSVLNRKFDLIESGGVLHHMRDPFAGWDVLLNLLKPMGLMKIGLYSKTARRNVVRLREIISELGLKPNQPDISRFRQMLLESPDSEDFGWVVRSPDFFSTSGCRDLLFHSHEHHMNLQIINQHVNQRGLSFLGFEIDNSVIVSYRQRFPSDKAAINLTNWEIFETENPDTFQGMYQFWIQSTL